jgi:hypothetical protein
MSETFAGDWETAALPAAKNKTRIANADLIIYPP